MIQETFPMIIGEEEIPNERALLTQEDGPMMASSASVKYIVIHCSATRSTRDYTAEQLLRDHKTRGFRTVVPQPSGFRTGNRSVPPSGEA